MGETSGRDEAGDSLNTYNMCHYVIRLDWVTVLLSDPQFTRSFFTNIPSAQVKESKRQFIFDVVNEGGEKEKMELFVNFCEDTIFEMQLAAQMSDAGERSAVKEESEREKPDEEDSEMGFFSVSTVRMALLALRHNAMLLIKVRLNVCLRLNVL